MFEENFAEIVNLIKKKCEDIKNGNYIVDVNKEQIKENVSKLLNFYESILNKNIKIKNFSDLYEIEVLTKFRISKPQFFIRNEYWWLTFFQGRFYIDYKNYHEELESVLAESFLSVDEEFKKEVFEIIKDNNAFYIINFKNINNVLKDRYNYNLKDNYLLISYNKNKKPKLFFPDAIYTYNVVNRFFTLLTMENLYYITTPNLLQNVKTKLNNNKTLLCQIFSDSFYTAIKNREIPMIKYNRLKVEIPININNKANNSIEIYRKISDKKETSILLSLKIDIKNLFNEDDNNKNLNYKYLYINTEINENDKFNQDNKYLYRAICKAEIKEILDFSQWIVFNSSMD